MQTASASRILDPGETLLPQQRTSASLSEFDNFANNLASRTAILSRLPASPIISPLDRSRSSSRERDHSDGSASDSSDSLENTMGGKNKNRKHHNSGTIKGTGGSPPLPPRPGKDSTVPYIPNMNVLEKIDGAVAASAAVREGSYIAENNDVSSSKPKDTVSNTIKSSAIVPIDFSNDGPPQDSDMGYDPAVETRRGVKRASESDLATAEKGMPSPASVSSSKKHRREANRYSATDFPPYLVHFQYAESNVTPDSLLISKIINGFDESIQEIRTIGNNKVRAKFETYQAANRVIGHPSLKKHNLIAFIPSFKIMRIAIVKGIPLCLSDNEITQEIESSVKIISIQRLNRRVKRNGESVFEPSKTILIKFEGQTLPLEIAIFKTKLKVEPYIPQIQICFSCFRFGHISSNCRSKAKCGKCTSESHANKDDCPRINLPPICINCKGDHLPTASTCPVFIKQKKIVQIAAEQNIPYLEARNKVENCQSSIYSPPPYFSSSDSYPSLPGSTSSSDSPKNTRFNFNAMPSLNSSPSSSPQSYSGILKNGSSRSQGNSNPSFTQRGYARNSSQENNQNINQHNLKEAHNDCLYYPHGREQTFNSQSPVFNYGNVPSNDRGNNSFHNPNPPFSFESLRSLFKVIIDFVRNLPEFFPAVHDSQIYKMVLQFCTIIQGVYGL
ncbi:uncharacterized protein [Temnothorax nylanderi]|uniref:uncharacterized protein isoform X1 n=1 Tax=Temnothorax nylanderi TaxID=102681 RepID=UPI003A87A42B